MKPISKMLAVIILLAVTGIKGWSYYYADNFAADNDAYWNYEYKYSRANGLWTDTDGIGTPSATGGVYQITGTRVWGSTTFPTEISSVFAKFTNTEFIANPQSPFGFEITVSRTELDSHGIRQVASYNPESGRMKAAMSFYLAYNVMSDGSHFDDYSSIVNFYRPQLGTNDTNLVASEPNTMPLSFWSLSEAGTRAAKFNFATAANPAGGLGGGNLTNFMEWCYDDTYGINTGNNASGTEAAEATANGSYPAGVANANYINNNTYRIRITTDGSTAYFYINPAPGATVYASKTLHTGATANLTNTYYLVASYPITFSNHIVPMFGIGNNRYDSESMRGDFDDFLIRSVCSSVTSEIYPSTVRAGGTTTIRGFIKPVFSSANEAGVQEVYIDLPTGYTWTTAMTNNFRMFWVTNNGSIYKTFIRQAGDSEPSAAGRIRMTVQDGGTRLKVRFYAAAASVDVFHPNNLTGLTSPALMFVISNFTTLGTADSTGKAFTIYVNNEKYPDSAWALTATTGKMKSRVGNYYNYGYLDNNTLTLKTVNDPVAYAAIRPTRIYEGAEATFYYDVSAQNIDNNADITKVFIQVAPGFTIDSLSLGSDRITNSANLYLSNTGSLQYIVADYGAEGVKLVAGSGIDTISFNNSSTTNFENTNEVYTYWPSYVRSWISGTGITTNGTSSMYPSQMVTIRKKPPDAEAYIQPATVRNTAFTNVYTYVVRNSGEAGNNIKKILIQMDQQITNIANFGSTIQASFTNYVSNTYRWLKVDYSAFSKVLSNGMADTITFTGWDNIRSLTNVILSASFPSYADNANGDGYMPVDEHPDTWDVSYYTPPVVIQAQIDDPYDAEGEYTNTSTARYFHYLHNDLTTAASVEIIIKNWGERENHIYYATIYCPVEITNVSSAVSARGALTAIEKVGQTNIIHIAYTNVGLLQAGATPAIGDEDTITLLVRDSITTSNSVKFVVRGDNTSNYNTLATPIANANNLNLIYVYAPPMADSYVEIPLTYIPTEFDGTNVVYYIYNRGNTGNVIRNATVHFSTTYISNVTFISNLLGNASINPSVANFTVNYSGDTFNGGVYDKIFFRLFDTVDAGQATFNATCSVQNDRWLTNNIGVTATKSQTININPPLTWYSYHVSPTVIYNATAAAPETNRLVLSVSNAGVGSNLLDRFRFQIPTELIGKILKVSNELTGITNTSSGPVKISNSYVWVDYDAAGTSLAAGDVDQTYIWVLIDSTNVFHSYWTTMAQNNSQPSLTNCNWMLSENGYLATNLLSVVDKPFGYISPSVILTPSISNTYSYSIQNGAVIGQGRSIQRIRLGYPLYFDNGISNVSGWGSVQSTYISNGVQWVVVSGSGISPNSSIVLSMKGYDTWTIGSNSVLSSLDVDYGDGSGWHSSDTWSGRSKWITFNNPTAVGLTYSTPNNVPQDYPFYTYQFYIKNNGEAGNNLQIIKIEAPSFITNITSVTSFVKSVNSFVSNGNIVYLFYTNASKLLQSSQTDMIQLVAYDNIDAPSTISSSWQISINNTTNMNGFVSATVAGGKSRELNIIRPSYSPYVSIIATNSVNTSLPNSIYSTITTNYLKFTIYNQSGSGNWITRARIRIPDAVILNTNEMTATCLIKTTATTVISNGYIWIDYSSANILPAQYDEILIKVPDTLIHTEATLTWSADVAFSSTYNIYKTADVYSGKSLAISYIMPSPSAVVTMTPEEIYMNKTSLLMNYAVSNSGSGTSDISQLSITIPSVFRSGFSISSMSNTFATTTNYSSSTGVLTLTYNGNDFHPGAVDNLYFYLNHNSTTSHWETFESTVVNYINSADTGGSKDIFISTVPTFYIETNNIDTTTHQNGFIVTVDNSINGTSPIERIVLNFPTMFTNIVTSSISGDPAQIMGTVTSLTLDYVLKGNTLPVSVSESLYITLLDNFDIGNMTNGILGWVDDGKGYVPLRVGTGSTNLYFLMPETESSSSIDPEYIYLGTVTNSMTVMITNKGSGSGNITYARITLPENFSNVHAITSAYGADATYDDVNSRILLQYTNYLAVGEADEITFDYDSLYSQATNLSLLVETANLTNNPIYYNCPGEKGAYSTITVSYPPFAVESYFAGDYRLYLIETNATLTYRLINRSYNTSLTQATITLSTNVADLFNSISLTSSYADQIVFDTNNNRFIIDYAMSEIQYGLYDDLKFSFEYSFDETFRFDLDTTAICANDSGTLTTNLTALTLSAYKSYISVTNSSWGVLSGLIFPAIYAVNVKLYYPGTTIAATNDTGGILGGVTSLSSGKYYISRIPTGNYSMTILGGNYYRDFPTNVVVAPDKINMVSTITLRNAPLQGRANNSQVVYCYENTNTYISFPAEAIETNKEFSIDITSERFTMPQAVNCETSPTIILAPGHTNEMFGYLFDLNDYYDTNIAGAIIRLDAFLHLAYSQTEIEGRGWQESDLAIYYWDDNGTTARWLRIGGTVDAEHNAVTANVGYVHTFYAVMSRSMETGEGIIQNVTLRPKVFTPTQDEDGYFGTIRLSFEIAGDPMSFNVKIYDLAGQLIREYNHEGTYNQGEISWDGLDSEGYAVKSGVYVYRIIAGGESYAGTIIIAR